MLWNWGGGRGSMATLCLGVQGGDLACRDGVTLQGPLTLCKAPRKTCLISSSQDPQNITVVLETYFADWGTQET